MKPNVTTILTGDNKRPLIYSPLNVLPSESNVRTPPKKLVNGVKTTYLYSDFANMYVMDEDDINFGSSKKINPNSSPYIPPTVVLVDNGHPLHHHSHHASHQQVSRRSSKEFRREIIDATGPVPTSTFSSPDNLSSPSLLDDLVAHGRQRSQSEHHLSSMLLSDAQKKSLGYSLAPPEKPPRAYQHGKQGTGSHHRPWSQLVTDRDIEMLHGHPGIFKYYSQNGDSPLVRKQKSDTDVYGDQRNLPTSMNLIKHKQHSEAALVENGDCLEPEVDSMMQKFKKSFSLRFSRRASSTRGVKSKLRQSLRAKSVDGRLRDSTNENNNVPPRDPKQVEPVIDGSKRDTGEGGDQVVFRNMSCVQRKQSVRGLRRSLSQPQNMEKSDLGDNVRVTSAESSRHVSSESDSDSEETQSEKRAQGDPNRNRHGRVGTPVDSLDALDQSDVLYVEALWDRIAANDMDEEELSFRAGEVIEVTDSSDRDWWWGNIGNRSGWFPVTHVRAKVNQEETLEECMSKMADSASTVTPKKRMSISMLSNEQVRSNCILEIVNTERDFVHHLNDVVEGYLVPITRHKEMFTEERISRIFGNIQQLYKFQVDFLAQLEKCINWDKLSSSQIGRCFLDNQAKFVIYSDYCNNHPLAVAELQELYAEPKYAHFFEACRLLRNMIDISLDGFLLTPVQKICKYPLQLAELLKYTRADHADHEPVKGAFAAMQGVAVLVNDRKRRLESLEQLYLLQTQFDNWEGPLLTETSSMLFKSGDVTRVTSNWSQSVTLFLFDRLIVYCKKDMRGKRYIYKGRINVDHGSQLESPEDGSRDQLFNFTCKHAFKMLCKDKDKWYMFCTKTSDERSSWTRAFRDQESQLLEDRKEGGFVVTEKERRAAQMYLYNKSKPRPKVLKAVRKPSKPRRPDTAVAEMVLDPSMGISRSGRAGSLPSYLHPSHSVSGSGSDRQQPLKKKGSGWFQLGSKSKKNSKRRPEFPYPVQSWSLCASLWSPSWWSLSLAKKPPTPSPPLRHLTPVVRPTLLQLVRLRTPVVKHSPLQAGQAPDASGQTNPAPAGQEATSPAPTQPEAHAETTVEPSTAAPSPSLAQLIFPGMGGNSNAQTTAATATEEAAPATEAPDAAASPTTGRPASFLGNWLSGQGRQPGQGPTSGFLG
ncbi:Spermatogenesis-associated protein 13 [Halotydeus destructor]|nr:Spermatogenesis-associated protein 13 [Halotydeus destructor]